MTTTQQPTQQPKRQPTWGRDNWVAGEKLCSKLCFFLVSRYVSTPGQCYARQTSEGTFFWAGKVCFYVFIWKKIACGHGLLASACICETDTDTRIWVFRLRKKYDLQIKKWSFCKLICVSGQQHHTFRQKRFTNSQYDTQKRWCKGGHQLL